jgi:branched-chain amino acid transport system permease protein
MLYLSGPRLLPLIAFASCCPYSWALLAKVLLSVAVFALLAISWDILAQSGMVSLGQALFFGMGAYCSGVLNHYLAWPPW